MLTVTARGVVGYAETMLVGTYGVAKFGANADVGALYSAAPLPVYVEYMCVRSLGTSRTWYQSGESLKEPLKLY